MSIDPSKKIVTALCVLRAGIGTYSITNVLIAYIAITYSSYPQATVMQLLSIPAIVGLAISFAVGPLSLKISKKILLMISSGSVLACCVTFLVVGTFRGPLQLLFMAVAFSGITQGSVGTLMNSTIHEYCPPDKTASYIALLTAVAQGATATLSLIAGFIAAGNGGASWPRAYTVGLVNIPLLILFFFLMPKEKTAPRDQPATVPSDALNETAQAVAIPPEPATDAANNRIPPRVFLMILMMFIFAFAMVSFNFNISAYIITENRLGTSAHAGTINSLFLIVGMAVAFTYSLWSKLLKNMICVLGIFLLVAGLFIMTRLHTTLAGAFIAAVLCPVGANFFNPYFYAKIMSATPRKMAPVSMSIATGVVNIAIFLSVRILEFVGGLFGGGLHNRILAGLIFGVVAGIMALFFVIFPEKPAVAKTNIQAA